MLTPERFIILNKSKQGKLHALHQVWSDIIMVNLFGKILQAGTEAGEGVVALSLWGGEIELHSNVCKNNLKMLL